MSFSPEFNAQSILVGARLEIAGNMEVSQKEYRAWETLSHASDYIQFLCESNRELAVICLEANGFKVSIKYWTPGKKEELSIVVEEEP